MKPAEPMKPAVRPSPTGPAASRGVTMVELMVAVTISLLITLVIAQLFLGSRQTFATTDDVSRMQENIRFTQQLLIRLVHLAGYKSQPNSVTLAVFNPVTNPALDATDGAGTASDTLTIRYQGSGNGAGTPDGTVVDCLGVPVDSGSFATNTFAIQLGANGRNALWCSNQPIIVIPLPCCELIPNVANMQILFGEDTNADLSADYYVALPSVVNPSNIVSVRIALLFETPTDVSKAIADATTYTVDPVTPVVLGPYTDRRIRRMMTTTINVRNRTP